jgi:hypothetical protein
VNGRRLYNQARALLRAKRAWEAKHGPVPPVEGGVVLQFPKRPSPPDKETG